MTRRGALTAVTALMVDQLASSSQSLRIFEHQPVGVTIGLDSWRDFTLRQGDRAVTVTPKELMDAIVGGK